MFRNVAPRNSSTRANGAPQHWAFMDINGA
jgi:hypothetical protein